MLSCFEYWFGPYPFYEDGYKLVQAPYLGMEHQSNIAYGNDFLEGYHGKDLSETGWGLKWDFIGRMWLSLGMGVTPARSNASRSARPLRVSASRSLFERRRCRTLASRRRRWPEAATW